MKLSGVSDSVKTNGEAAIPSSPAKPVAQTGNSSRDDNPIKSKCATAGSKSPIKPIGKTGILSRSAMASSRVFLDSDVQETLFYLNWLNSNLDVASRVNAEVVVKPEPATLGELFSYMNQTSSKVAWYLTKLSVYDHNDQAVFVVLGDAGEELTGKNAAELVERYYQANDSVGGDHIVPVPQAMIDTIGQTRKFIVKVSNHNLTAKTQTLTVTKVLPPDAPEPEGNLGENVGEKPIGGYSRRHHSHESTIGYHSLCLRGFMVQGSLDPRNRLLEDVFRIIDNIGSSYTVLHMHPFCPRVVREFISNKTFNEEGALIRGFVYRFSSSAITHLTGGQCSGWTGFNLNALLNPFQVLYRVCEHNWLPGPESDLMIKKRLRLLYVVAKRKEIDFGQLVYEQVIDMTRLTDLDTSLIFPNLIYQLLVLQKEVPLLPGDEEPIGRGLPIYGLGSDGSGPRGRRRLC
ncbi:hypothetical protein F2Q69_00020249 [Brassica cretica]|uniref:Putative plant transposon protein domain-containing protein n=1 Tax=Brassica cretica TaxID=69181 RepID=A0A8S9Q6E7_BRACR|nr:hypothetical protein F2Q69_00020249 [Brassica cretica]